MTERTIFLEALDKGGPAERAAYLGAVCGEDAALRERVEKLLAAHAAAGGILDRPAVEPPGTDLYRPITEGPGTRVGPYKLLQQIGEGGFGVVYMAEQQEPLRRMVALKILKPGVGTREVIARFESERVALSLMDHPNIARVLDAGETASGRPYFVMELVKGVPVTEFCDKNHMPAEDRLRLFVSVCHAIQHAHHKGVIHRDVKPSNVLVTLHDGVPVAKVIDFGVAKTAQRLTEKTLFTAFGQMVGTPAYMSPEQAEMSGLDIDTRSDVYSLGVLLYELLTGTTPLDLKRLREAGYAEMQRLIRDEEAPWPSTRLSSLGGEASVLAGNRGTDPRRLARLLAGDLDWVVMKALEKDRNRRYGTPGNFADDIGRYLRGEAIEARPPSVAYRVQKFARRNRAAVAVAAVVVLALVVAVAGTSAGLIRAVEAEHRARDDAARARDAEQLAESRLIDAQAQRAKFQEAAETVLTYSKALQVAADRAESGRLAAHSTAVWPTNPGLALMLAVAGAQKSPDRSAPHNNALLAAVRDCREERTLFAPPFQTREGRTGRTEFVALQVTPDGRHAVVVGHRLHDPLGDPYLVRATDDSAQVYDLHTGRVTAAMKLPGLRFATMTVSPDGTTLAAAADQGVVIRFTDGPTVAYTDTAVRLWDVRTGQELRVLKGHADRVSSLAFDAHGDRLLSASWDGTARVWDVRTGRPVHVFEGPRSLACAEFGPDGRRVVTVSTGSKMTGARLDEWLDRRPLRDNVRPDQVLIDPPARADAAIKWLEPLTGTTSAGGPPPPPPQLWDAATGKRLAALGAADKQNRYPGVAVAFSADGARVVTAGSDGTQVWDAEDGKAVPGVEPQADGPGRPLRDGDRVLRVVPHSTGFYGGTTRLLVWQSDKDRPGWRRAPTASRLTTTSGRGDRPPVFFLAVAPAGRPLEANAVEDQVAVSDTVTGEAVVSLRGHDDRVTAAAFLPDGTRLVTAARDGTLRVWSLDPRHDPVVELKWAAGPGVGYARYVPATNQVVTAPPRNDAGTFAGKTPTFWRADGSRASTQAEVNRVMGLATSPLHKQLLDDLGDFGVSPDGSRLVTVHRDHNPCADPKDEPKPSPLYTPVRVWDVKTGNLVFALAGLRRSVATARFSPDGRRLLTFSDGNYRYAIVRGKGEVVGNGSGGQLWARVDVWDAGTGAHLRNLVPEARAGRDFAVWSPDGKRVLTNAATTGDKVAAGLFDPDTGERVSQLLSDAAAIDRAEFSPDGKLVLGYRLRYLRDQVAVEVWDAPTGARRATLRGHTGNVTCASFSPDGHRIVTTSTDGTARIWNATTGDVRHVLRGHRHVVRTGRFSPDGKWVVTASADGTARVWAADPGREWMTLQAQGEMVSGEFTPDSQVLTASTDGVARLWPVDPLPLAAARRPRELTADERARYQVE